MSNKFNMNFLAAQQESDIINKFKDTEDIFNKENRIIDILPVDKLVPFSKHPFKVHEGDRLNDLVESIAEQGVLVPLIVRTHPELKGAYEILAGHHRHTAALRAGLHELPCIIKNVDDNTAALIVVESNKQRGFADMLPSEIAKALKLEYDALKSQGKRSDLMAQLDEILSEKTTSNTDNSRVCSTSVPVEQKLNSRDNLSQKNSMSSANIQRYIRLNSLIPELLDRVDNNEIAIRPAVDLSYLNTCEQQIVFDCLLAGYLVDMKKSEKLKEYSQAGKINQDTVKLIMTGAVFEVKAKKLNAIKLPVKKVRDYLPSNLSQSEYEDYVIEALKFYSENTEE